MGRRQGKIGYFPNVPSSLEVYGVSLWDQPPIAVCHLRLDQLTVLYGKNGVGKSIILRAISDAFEGIEPRQGAVMLWGLAREPDPPPPRALWRPSTFAQAVLSYPPTAMDAASSWEPSFTEVVFEAVDAIFPPNGPSAVGGRAAEAGLVGISPVGTTDAPMWQLHLCCPPVQPDSGDHVVAEARYGHLAWADGSRQFLDPRLPIAHEDDTPIEAESWRGDPPTGLFGHPWIPLPLVEAGPFAQRVVGRPIGRVDVATVEELTVEKLTTGQLVAERDRGRRLIADGDGQFEDWVREWLLALAADATRLIGEVLEDALELRCAVAPLEEWLDGPPVVWQFRDRPQQPWLAISQASRAQQLWAEFAIRVALRRRTLPASSSGDKLTPLLIIDEPETALHSAAQTTMAAGLSRLAAAVNAKALVATHSRALLDRVGVSLVHVRRGADGSVEVHQLEPSHDLDAEALGLSRADLLQLTRLLVLVEGAHDEIVFGVLLEDELRTARARLIPMRGAKNLLALSPEFLFDFSEAAIVVLTDKADRASLLGAWTAAQAAARTGADAEGIAEAFTATFARKLQDEERWIRDFAVRAATHRAHRLVLDGVPADDILDYLPVTEFVPTARSWDDLRAQHHRSGVAQPFKQWLQTANHADLTVAHIEAVARGLDHIPTEIVALGTRLLEYSAFRD